MSESTGKVQVEFDAPNSLLINTAISSAEGGSGYWAQIYEYDWKAWDDITDDTPLPDCFTFYTIAELDERQVAYDWGNPMHVTAGALRRGIAYAILDGYTTPATIEDDMDSTLADIILQYAVLGTIIYG